MKEGAAGTSIFRTLVYALAGTGIVAALISGVAHYAFTVRLIEDSVRQDMETAVSAATSYLERSYSVTAADDLRMLAASPAVESLLIGMGNDVYIRRPPVERQFVRLNKSRGDIYNALHLYDALGKRWVGVRHGKRERELAGDHDQFDNAIKDIGVDRLYKRLESEAPGSILYSDPVRHMYDPVAEKGRWLVVAGIAREEPEIGGFGGAIIMELDLTHYLNYLAQLRIFGRQLAWLLDNNGNVLFRPNSNSNSLDPRPYLLGDKELSRGEAVFVSKPASASSLSSRLRVIFSISPDAYTERMGDALSLLLGVFAAVALFGYVAARIFARVLAAPIEGLSRAVSSVGQGELNVKLPERWTGEVGKLSHGFNRIVDSLQSTTVSIGYVNNILNSMNDALIVTDENTCMVTANPALTKMLGFEEETLVGEPIAMLFADPELVESATRLENSMRAVVNLETEFVAADGGHVPVSLSGSPLSDRGGRRETGYVFVAQDETERRKAASELARQKNVLEAIFEHVPDAMMVMDTERRILMANRANKRIYGYDKEEIIGERTRIVYANEDEWKRMGRLRFNEDIEGSPGPVLTRLKRKDGEEFPGEVIGSPVRDQDGRLIGYVGLARDVTERRRAEEALRRQTKSVHLLQRIATAANEARSLKDALRVCLKDVCELIGWPVGHAFDFSAAPSPPAEAIHLWYLDKPDVFEVFRAGAERRDLSLDCKGLANRAYVQHKAVWLPDVTIEPGFDRRFIARDAGLRAGFAFPVTVLGQVRAVLEFFSEEVSKPDPGLMALMTNVGTLLGRVIEREDAARALRASEFRFRDLYDKTPAMFMTVDSNGTILSVNDFGAAQLGYRPEDLIGRQAVDVHVELDRKTLKRKISACFTEPNRIKHWETELLHRHGDEIHARTSARVVPGPTREPQLLMVCEDITETRNLSERLKHQASHDALTGLVNRREFENRVEALLASSRENGEEHVLCYLDLDQFKIINDTCGHMAGDELLRQLASALNERMRRSDTLARLGGDEFGILMISCSLEDGYRIAEKIRAAIEDFRFHWQRMSFDVGVSIGVVPVNASSGGMADLLSAADTACYAAKDEGRNRVHVASPEDHELERRRGEMQMVSRINDALEDDRFQLFIQPIVPLPSADGVTEAGPTSYEVLLRMREPSGRIVPPGAFLPAAERYSLGPKLDTWVVSHALKWLSRNQEFLERIGTLSINLSGASLDRYGVLERIIEEIQQTEVPPERICFEVTETAAVANLSSAIRFINALKGLGCQFALDDFGSGLSSFAYLKSLPVDLLKIDGVFVKDMLDDPIDRAMVKSINEMAHVMGKKTVAEFVENDALIDVLIALGVDYAQGHAVGRPTPIDDFCDGMATRAEAG
jgi:diguanylate cyclase (GGDEF)-like protein/PAS domain S-box-containing protein